MNDKTCTKCLLTFPATRDHFYANKGGKYGLTPRCKACVNEDNNASLKKRLEREPALVKQQAAERTRRHYFRNLDRSREKARLSAEKARKDHIKAERIRARKRAGGAGLSPEEIEAIKDAQNNQCAICGTPDPTDLDHCHGSNKVRWLLCTHCNRGLGAFKDSPELLRKAAHLLDTFIQTQPSEPTPSKYEGE